ncbi:hypothetical protein HY086_01770 [Candidatus Gottesmanbacteria bacterium]|nr:hypothetical protein [Candidatus Gottesmanbacteria bacterium]
MVKVPKPEMEEEETLVKPVEEKLSMKIPPMVLGVYVVLIALGVGTGYLLSHVGPAAGGKPTMIKTAKTVGLSDTKTFKDSAEGVIQKGGVDGEGTHQLVREGGPSQTAFLISSVVDLDEYVGKKVRLWGETFAAKKASWLMDVGKIELLE